MRLKSTWTILFILILTSAFSQIKISNDSSIIKTRGTPIYFIDGIKYVNGHRASDTCNNESTQKLKKKYLKAVKRHKTLKYEYGKVAFQVAECYRLNNDTNYLTWYKRTIEINKAAYIGCDKNEIKHNILSQTAYSYYYIKDFKTAEQYFNKSISFCRMRDVFKDVYYLAICLVELGQYQEAIVEFNNYLKLYPNDKKDSEDYILKCNEKINGK